MIGALPAVRRPRVTGRRLHLLGHEVRITGALDRREAQLLLANREEDFAPFLSTAEVTRVNRAAGARVELSVLVAQTLAAALAAAAATDGLVSPVRGDARGSWRDVRLRGRQLERPPGLLLELSDHVLARSADEVLSLGDGEGTVAIDRCVAARGLVEARLPVGGGVRFGTTPADGYGVAQRTTPSGDRWRELTVVAGSAFDAFVGL